ncbi:HD domain-containing protein [Natronosalvus amylolyticus]|uniref:HD domain-containing protein n=1 Tax=Natronosalvus amylolyticus TaxID=2961994 RepID=UPI0020C97D4C|nr:HD domain-containing protein [Natronosalvus amylolyticus]
MVLERVRPIARSYFDERVAPAHDWHHVKRVETNAKRLVQSHSEADEQTVFLAVLLHDIGRPAEDAGTVDDHAEWGAREARTILEELEADVESERIDAVAHCIRAHRFSNDVEPRTLEARILSDADNLDALGAIGLARTFSYGGERGTTIYDSSLPPEADGSSAGKTSVNHVHKKLLALPDRMYTEAGRTLAEERCAFIESFLETLEGEVGNRGGTADGREHGSDVEGGPAHSDR